MKVSVAQMYEIKESVGRNLVQFWKSLTKRRIKPLGMDTSYGIAGRLALFVTFSMTRQRGLDIASTKRC